MCIHAHAHCVNYPLSSRLARYRGIEVTADVIDGPQSVIYDQAENRQHAQKAVVLHLLGVSV